MPFKGPSRKGLNGTLNGFSGLKGPLLKGPLDGPSGPLDGPSGPLLNGVLPNGPLDGMDGPNGPVDGFAIPPGPDPPELSLVPGTNGRNWDGGGDGSWKGLVTPPKPDCGDAGGGGDGSWKGLVTLPPQSDCGGGDGDGDGGGDGS
eukprot:1429865-Prymnesium_polylepis.1